MVDLFDILCSLASDPRYFNILTLNCNFQLNKWNLVLFKEFGLLKWKRGLVRHDFTQNSELSLLVAYLDVVSPAPGITDYYLLALAQVRHSLLLISSWKSC